MTHQGISIDGLIQASDSLRYQVKAEDVEMRRELAIKQELASTPRERSTTSITNSVGKRHETNGSEVKEIGWVSQTQCTNNHANSDED